MSSPGAPPSPGRGDGWWMAPAALSLLVLGAHLLFHGQSLLVPVCVGLLLLLWVRAPWAARVLQAVLVLAAVEWARTLVADLAQRRAAGQPWVRMAVILGAVGAVALVAALLFETPALRRRFGRAGPVRG